MGHPSTALEGVHGLHLVPHSPFQLEEMNRYGDVHQSTCGSSVVGVNQHLKVRRVWEQRPACLRPIQCSLKGDKNFAETIANVITSLPFIAVGFQAPRKNLNCRIYANSLIGVGVASSLYHASRGKLKKYLRRVDYTMIATATVCLSRASRNENPKLLMAASALFLPVRPFMVSAVHTGMMEPSMVAAKDYQRLRALTGLAMGFDTSISVGVTPYSSGDYCRHELAEIFCLITHPFKSSSISCLCEDHENFFYVDSSSVEPKVGQSWDKNELIMEDLGLFNGDVPPRGQND